jgi:hypothetical protein
MKLYKLTDENGCTQNNTQWGEGVTHKATGRGTTLCSDGFIHAYESPLVAAFMNPIHAGFHNPRLWEAEGEVVLRDDCLKCGCKKLSTIKEIPLPEITLEQRVKIARKCADWAAEAAEWAADLAATWDTKWAAEWAADLAATWAAEQAADLAARAADLAAKWAAEWAAEDSVFDLHKIIENVLGSEQ